MHLGPKKPVAWGPSKETIGLCTDTPARPAPPDARSARDAAGPLACSSAGSPLSQIGSTLRGALPTGLGVLETVRRQPPAQRGDAAPGRVPESQQQGTVPSPDSLRP